MNSWIAKITNYLNKFLELGVLLLGVSVIAEILFGILLFFRKTRTFASYGIITLLVCVFPANIHLVGSELSQSILEATKDQTIIRLPFQALFILLAFWHSKNN